MKCKGSKKIWPLFFLLFSFLLSLTACGSQQKADLVNVMTFSLNGIEELTISYDEEELRFFSCENDILTIKEYMSKDKKSYYAKVSQDSDSIQIHEGGKPFFKDGFIRYVEVYLPESYSEALKVTATDGTIDMSEIELDMESIRVDCTSGIFKAGRAKAEEIYFSSTSGTLELGNITGGQIRIETTQGEVSCEKANGTVIYNSTSGNAEFRSVLGSGTYKAGNSGKLSVTYDEVTGDVSLFNKNDDIELRLPPSLSFEFEAITKNGSVNTNLRGDFSTDEGTTSGTVGSDPAVTVKVETKNGNIEVIQ